jgi:hypothetical protein
MDGLTLVCVREVTFDPSSPGNPSSAPIDGHTSLSSLACPSATQCTAVDAAGDEVTFNEQSLGKPVPFAIDRNPLASVA